MESREQVQFRSKPTSFHHPLMRATIGKSHGFVSSTVSSMFMYNYLEPHAVPILIDKFQYIRRETPWNACVLALIIRKID